MLLILALLPGAEAIAMGPKRESHRTSASAKRPSPFGYDAGKAVSGCAGGRRHQAV